MTPLTWSCRPFAELGVDLLYAILTLRTAAFVVEQNCAFQEQDGADPGCWHLCGQDDQGALLAYARLVPAGLLGAEPRVGRVITDKSVRGTGLGGVLMKRALEEVEERWPGPIRVTSQVDVAAFYERLGFLPQSEPYDEDGIMHQDLVRPG